MEQSTSRESVRKALETILPRVQKPSRYLGIERNLVRKPWDAVDLRVALAFPTPTRSGCPTRARRSSTTWSTAGQMHAASAPTPRCRTWPQALRAAGVPLYSLESYRPVAAFDVVGITLQSELNYVNVPYLLDLAGIPRRRRARRRTDPIVLGGGPCTANPEPVADFFDAILIGDAEASRSTRCSTSIRDGRLERARRRDILRRLAARAGGLRAQPLPLAPGDCGHARRGGRRSTMRRRCRFDGSGSTDSTPADQPERPIVPFAEVVQDRLGIEIMRGCTQGCRFCQAGYWYRPVREHDPEAVADRMMRQVARARATRRSVCSACRPPTTPRSSPWSTASPSGSRTGGCRSACPACAPTRSRSGSPRRCLGSASRASPSPPRPARTACAGSSTRPSPTPTWSRRPRPPSRGAGT